MVRIAKDNNTNENTSHLYGEYYSIQPFMAV